MPTIVMLISTHASRFDTSADTVAVEVDKQKQRTLCIAWIEENVYLVIVLQGAQEQTEKRDAVVAHIGTVVNILRLQTLIAH